METVTVAQIGVRLPRVLLVKLDRLARETQRNRSEVVRLLLEQATVTGRPDIALEREETTV